MMAKWKLIQDKTLESNIVRPTSTDEYKPFLPQLKVQYFNGKMWLPIGRFELIS